jgi:hypothetical protein
MLKALALGAVILALGTGLGWVVASPRSGGGAARSVAPDRRVEDELRGLRELVETLRGDLALRSAAPPAREREPVERGPSLADLAEQIAALERALTALRSTIASGTIPARFPPFELVRRSPDLPDWDRLQVFVEDRRQGGGTVSEELLKSVKWKSQEEIMLTYGRPSYIEDNGNWIYSGWDVPSVRAAVRFRFIEDYVSFVDVTN